MVSTIRNRIPIFELKAVDLLPVLLVKLSENSIPEKPKHTNHLRKTQLLLKRTYLSIHNLI